MGRGNPLGLRAKDGVEGEGSPVQEEVQKRLAIHCPSVGHDEPCCHETLDRAVARTEADAQQVRDGFVPVLWPKGEVEGDHDIDGAQRRLTEWRHFQFPESGKRSS